MACYRHCFRFFNRKYFLFYFVCQRYRICFQRLLKIHSYLNIAGWINLFSVCQEMNIVENMLRKSNSRICRFYCCNCCIPLCTAFRNINRFQSCSIRKIHAFRNHYRNCCLCIIICICLRFCIFWCNQFCSDPLYICNLYTVCKKCCRKILYTLHIFCCFCIERILFCFTRKNLLAFPDSCREKAGCCTYTPLRFCKFC